MAHTTTTKICSKCKRPVSLEKFSPVSTNGGRLRARCNPCRSNDNRKYYRGYSEKVKEANRQWRKDNPEYNRNAKLKAKYGITVDEYEALHREQNGRCALCGTDEPGGRYNRLHVDHCHSTGRVRGLLCNRCNVALGSLGDDVEGLRKALKYVGGSQWL